MAVTTLLLSDEKLLGDNYKGHTVTPIASTFYKKYIYRVTFGDTSFRKKLRSWAEDNIANDYKIRVNRIISKKGPVRYQPIRLYLMSIDDLNLVLDTFNDGEIAELSGVTNSDLRDQLADDKIHLESKPHKYFQKFEYKVVCAGPKIQRTPMGFPRGPHNHWRVYSIRRARLTPLQCAKILEFISCQASTEDYVYRKSFDTLTIFGTNAVAKEIMPLIRLTQPDVHLKVYKCVTPII